VYFNGPKPRGILWLEALRGTFEIAHLAGECGGETRGKGEYGEMLKNLSTLSIMILINLVCCRLSEA
jgi:hypothetical protein